MSEQSQHTGPEYDLFVSYSPADREWVEGYLLDALNAANVRVLSELNFALGAPRISEFERAVKSSNRTLLVLSPAYMAEAALQFVDIMVQHFGLESGTWPVIPLLLKPVELPPRLAFLVALDATDPQNWTNAVARLCSTLHAAMPVPTTRPQCPYPGMRAFREQDATHFYGREAEIEELLQRLRRHPFLAVIGPSGSGKSSLVNAGLIPALRSSTLFGPGTWLVRTIRPGARPMAELALALGTTDVQQFVPAALLAAEQNATHLLLVVDQLEEVFTQGSAQKEVFFDAIQRLSALRDCYVVVTVRADFFGDLLASTLWTSIQAHRLEIAPLGARGLHDAIVKPAEKVGVFIESALVERLVAGSTGQPGLLPFVQEVMVRLWEKLERRYLPLRAYEALILSYSKYTGSERSGIQAAMAQVADEIVNQLTPEQQIIARRIFMHLVQFGEGRADTRRQQFVSELRASGDNVLLFDRTLYSLADNRLITLNGEADGEPRVDLAHEAMLVGWPLLRGWIDEHKTAEQTRRRLEQRAQEWADLGQGDRGLLTEQDFREIHQATTRVEVQQLGITTRASQWLTACERYIRRRHRRQRILQIGVVSAAIVLLAALLISWATINPIESGWHTVASPITFDTAGEPMDFQIKLDHRNPDRVFILDRKYSHVFVSEDGGESWDPVSLGNSGEPVVDVTVVDDVLYVLYPDRIVVKAADPTTTVVQLPDYGENIQVVAFAVESGKNRRLVTAYSNGHVDLSTDQGKTWTTLIEKSAGTLPIRVGFSGDQIVMLLADSIHLIDLGSGQVAVLQPDPPWPSPGLDLAVPSSTGRFLVAIGDKGIVDGDVSGPYWSSYDDDLPTGIWSLSAWDNDTYAVGANAIYCNRLWNWKDANWWRARLGRRTPDTN